MSCEDPQVIDRAALEAPPREHWFRVVPGGYLWHYVPEPGRVQAPYLQAACRGAMDCGYLYETPTRRGRHRQRRWTRPAEGCCATCLEAADRA